VTDYGNHTVRKITPAGMVSTVAGMPGVAGANDGHGSDSRFINPHGITVDKDGNLFVTDLGSGQTNGTIRKISPDGLVTTIAGSMTVSGTNDGPGGAALFRSPWGITVDDNDNLFVSDTLNHTIRKLTSDGTNWEVSTVAGLPGSASLTDGTNSDARFLNPDGLAMDQAHNLIVADEMQIGGGIGAIRKMTPIGTNWVVSTVVGPTTFDYLSAPSTVAVDTNGCLYVADQHNHSIRKVIPDGTNWIVATIADFSKTAIKNPFSLPHGIALDQLGNMYLVDYGVSLVLKGWSSDSPPKCILNPPQINGGQVQLGVLVQTGSPTNFTLLQADQITGPWTTNSSWLLTTNIPGLNYGMTTLMDASFFRFYQLLYQ
jgi:sugar lactone lactonase YvrE